MSFENNREQAEELLEAQAHVWNQLFSFISSSSLKCAVELNIPDIIHKHAKPMTMSELIDALPINKAKASCVPRLMRILTHSGFFKSFEEGFLLTPASRLLLNDEPLSVKPFLLAMLDPLLVDPWHLLSEWFKNDRPTTFETFHGKQFWECAGEPRMNNLFNEAMASDARFVTSLVIKDRDQKVFDGIKSLVDVGGGTGKVAKDIGDAFPDVKCCVLDLPHVVHGLQGTNNVTYIGGDMFEFIPPADALLLKWILHDWSDEECVKILKKCKEAIPSKENGGKVIIMDMVVGYDKKDGDEKSIKTQLYFDMLMMVLVTGRERNEKDWSKLFYDAGFNGGYKINPVIGLRSVIEVYP